MPENIFVGRKNINILRVFIKICLDFSKLFHHQSDAPSLLHSEQK